ncbi:MAG: hypothetical protein KAS49_05855 [Candidatus Cloacimonetes bacterium]|nr:hypothetical protein [Candidatus Cloacimonadota bacterium]
MYKLEDEHLEKAKEMAKNNRTKKNCDNCYDRGYIGINEQNMLIPCHKCVDLEKVMDEWKSYVSEIPKLKEEFKELFEEDEE